MQSREMARGRLFIIKLDDGEFIKQSIESFAKTHGIENAFFTLEGNVAADSSFVTGLREIAVENGHLEPIVYKLDNNYEFFGSGTLALSAMSGNPVIHLHGSVGRNGQAVTGCFRDNVRVWLTMEVVLQEVLGEGLCRKFDDSCGVRSLEID